MRCIFSKALVESIAKFLYLNHYEEEEVGSSERDLTGMPRQFSGHKLELNRREKKQINNMLDLDFMTPIFIL